MAEKTATVPADGETANLQKPETAKEWAEHLGMSERQFYKFKLVYSYRRDLADKVAAKEMSIHAAWLETTGRTKDTSRSRLVRAWNNASERDKAELIDHIRKHPFSFKSLEQINSETAICLPDRSNGAAANLQPDSQEPPSRPIPGGSPT